MAPLGSRTGGVRRNARGRLVDWDMAHGRTLFWANHLRPIGHGRVHGIVRRCAKERTLPLEGYDLRSWENPFAGQSLEAQSRSHPFGTVTVGGARECVMPFRGQT